MIAFVRTIFCAYHCWNCARRTVRFLALKHPFPFGYANAYHKRAANSVSTTRHIATLTNWRTLSSLRMMHVGRWQPAAVHHSRDATQRMHLSTHASAAETSSATRPIIHRVADRWSLPRNYRLGIRDKLGIFVAYLDYFVGWNVTASWRDVGKYRILRRASRSAMTNESH